MVCFIFFVAANDENKARKIVCDTMVQIKEKYNECEDWEITMISIGGIVWK